jgi:hypothetical protein
MPAGQLPPPAPPPSSSSADQVDVYIVGGEPLDAPALLKVAGLIASHYRVAPQSVAEGLSGGQCLVTKQLAAPAAKRLAEELGDLGARTATVSTGTKPTAHRPTPARTAATAAGQDRRRDSGLPASHAPAVPGGVLDRVLGGALQDPLKRAFAGLALALLIGFLPAAYYSFGINGAEVRRIRARQGALSAQPGTKAIIDEFDHLEAVIADVRHRGLIHTAILWVLVTGIAGGGLSRLVARGDRAPRSA